MFPFSLFLKLSPVVLMLFSGIFHSTLATNRLRSFNFTGTGDWNNANNTCNERNQSLVTIYDQEDITFVQSLVGDSDDNPKTTWLGLHKTLGNASAWSDGFPFTFNNSSANVSNGEQRCEAIDKDVWRDYNCSDRKHFMCQPGSKYLITNEMNWCQARDYCRRHFQSNLVSIRDETQNKEVIEEGQNNTFWIGLMHDEWKWEDNGCSTYREWHDWIGYSACAAVSKRKLYERACENDGPIVCSTGAVRIKIIQRNSTWEEAFDYCETHHSRLLQIEDDQDQKSVEQWLNHLMNGTFWIGLRQSRLFGFWLWADKPVDYDHWLNNIIPEMPTSENCGVINTEDYRWRDENCWYLHPFLCEEDIIHG